MSGAIEIRWRRLRLPVAAFAAAALAGGAAAATAWWNENRIAERAEAAELRLAEARARHSALVGEQRQWRRFAPLYRRLAARGQLGEERPERWTDAVRSAAAGVAAARHRLGVPYAVERSGPVEVRAADMTLDLEMRHEAELPVFLAALDREASGLFTVSGCRLVRGDPAQEQEQAQAQAQEQAPSGAGVSASCRIRWQSVVLSGVEPGWTPAAGDRAGDDAGAAPAESRPDPAEPSLATFGRLFNSPAERAEIDSARFARRPDSEPAEAPEVPLVRSERPPPRTVRWVRVGGLVARSGRSVFAWIDGRRVTYGDSRPEHAESEGARRPGVHLDAGGRSIVVRPGQRFNPVTGAVTDPIRSPRGRFERARSLQGSSSVPLTDSRVDEQN